MKRFKAAMDWMKAADEEAARQRKEVKERFLSRRLISHWGCILLGIIILALIWIGGSFIQPLFRWYH